MTWITIVLLIAGSFSEINGGKVMEGIKENTHNRQNNVVRTRDESLAVHGSNCPDGYYGANCQIYSNCASYPCLNGGTCQDITDGYVCTCPPGYTGTNCDVTVNECSSSPCLNGATCVDYINAYQCICPPGITGMKCETNINECASNPCQNNGTCYDYDNGYTCSCPPENNGENCQYGSCQFYIIERSTYGLTSGGGFISKVDEKGNVIRLSSTGEPLENSMVRDGSLLFYGTGGDNHVWRASTDNPADTRTIIWGTTTDSVRALGISRSDQRLFIDESDANVIVMIDYDGTLIGTKAVGLSTGLHEACTTDEANRVLYFTDADLDYICSVRYAATGFNGSVTILLSGTNVGDLPTGIVFIAQENRLYWILRNTQEIRSVVIGTSTVQVVAPADTLGGETYALTACGGTLFYTHSSGGVWRISTDYGRVKITKGNTLPTRPIATA